MQSRVELILASGSNRRCKLLNQLGIVYTTYVSNIDETPSMCEDPSKYVQRIAKAKAKAARDSCKTQLPILAADTVITIDRKILGKPSDQQAVKRYLRRLSGREHQVLTALCLWTKQKIHESVTKTIVKFRELSSSEVDKYSLTDEPYGKAGAYAIQGYGAEFIDYFLGSYTNVIGLPLLEAQRIINKI